MSETSSGKHMQEGTLTGIAILVHIGELLGSGYILINIAEGNACQPDIYDTKRSRHAKLTGCCRTVRLEMMSQDQRDSLESTHVKGIGCESKRTISGCLVRTSREPHRASQGQMKRRTGTGIVVEAVEKGVAGELCLEGHLRCANMGAQHRKRCRG